LKFYRLDANLDKHQITEETFNRIFDRHLKMFGRARVFVGDNGVRGITHPKHITNCKPNKQK
jgi:hypothetical protein